MKKLLLLLALATVFMSSTCSKSSDDVIVSSSQNIPTTQVPTSVISAFNSRYPTATGQIEWELEDGNTYKVKFFIGTQRKQVFFTSNGTFISEKNI